MVPTTCGLWSGVRPLRVRVPQGSPSQGLSPTTARTSLSVLLRLSRTPGTRALGTRERKVWHCIQTRPASGGPDEPHVADDDVGQSPSQAS